MCNVCIFGTKIDSVLRGIDMKGGAELQMALIAKALAFHGITVKVIDPEVSKSYNPLANLAIEAIPKWKEGIPGVRLFSHRIPNLIRCLRATHARVYYVRGFSFLYLLVLFVAKCTRSKFVLAVASDTDLMRFYDRYKIMYRRNASLWTWLSTIIPNEIASSILIKGADILLVQHDLQRVLAKSREKCIVRVNNILGDDVLQTYNRSERKNIIVVGCLSAIKGLHVLLPVIKELQQIIFEFVGEPKDREGETVKRNLARFPNVVLHGVLDRRKTLDKIAGAKALLNTSRAEGFPNTFLEAWALGTPVISLFVDPGGVIKSNHLGYVCDGDLRLFKDLLLTQNYEINETNIKQYVLENHRADQVVRFFEGLLNGDALASRVNFLTT